MSKRSADGFNRQLGCRKEQRPGKKETNELVSVVLWTLEHTKVRRMSFLGYLERQGVKGENVMFRRGRAG